MRRKGDKRRGKNEEECRKKRKDEDMAREKTRKEEKEMVQDRTKR
jgi:hypothetical protein